MNLNFYVSFWLPPPFDGNEEGVKICLSFLPFREEMMKISRFADSVFVGFRDGKVNLVFFLTVNFNSLFLFIYVLKKHKVEVFELVGILYVVFSWLWRVLFCSKKL